MLKKKNTQMMAKGMEIIGYNLIKTWNWNSRRVLMSDLDNLYCFRFPMQFH